MPPDIYARLQGLAATAQINSAEMRPILLRVTTDMFVLHAEHTDEEIRLYEEMARRLIDDADAATLALVARKLATCSDAPTLVLNRLRAKGGEAAREIVQFSRQIEWRELRRLAVDGAWDVACAVAGRSDLDREIAAILAARPEREIARALAANTLAPLNHEDVRLLALRGRDDVTLARALLNRGEITLDHLPLYLTANAEQRDILFGLVRQASLAQTGRPETMPKLDENLVLRLETTALRQKRTSFALALADLLGCDALCARRIVEDETGDALALAFLAIGLPAEAAARIFLIAFPKIGQSPDIFIADMKMIATTPRRDAARIIAAVTGATGRQSAAFTRNQSRRAGETVSASKQAPASREVETQQKLSASKP